MKMKKNRRQLRNLWLEPLWQIKLGIYNILLGVSFAFGVLGITLLTFESLHNLLNSLEEEGPLKEIFLLQLESTRLWILGLLGLYSLISIFLTAIQTHQFLGPIQAFTRQIKSILNGNFEQRIQLRKGDALTDLATQINRLSEHLYANQGHIYPVEMEPSPEEKKSLDISSH